MTLYCANIAVFLNVKVGFTAAILALLTAKYCRYWHITKKMLSSIYNVTCEHFFLFSFFLFGPHARYLADHNCTPPAVTFKNSTFYPTQCIYVFCVDLRTNSDYFPIQHYLMGFFYNRDGLCLLEVRTGCSYVVQTSGYYIYHRFNIHKFHVLSTQCIYVFCVDLRTNSDYFPIQHYLTGFYIRDGLCLLCSTH